MILSEFDIEYVERKSIKGQAIVDQLVDSPVTDDHPLVTQLPDESIFNMESSNLWTLYFDGSFTHGGSSAGILFITPQGDCIPKAYKIQFPCTNNIVEYEALLSGLRMAIQWKILDLCVLGDSQLVIK